MDHETHTEFNRSPWGTEPPGKIFEEFIQPLIDISRKRVFRRFMTDLSREKRKRDGIKKWRRGWESNPHDTVLQTAPLTFRAPRLEIECNISPFFKKNKPGIKKKQKNQRKRIRL